MTALRKAVLDRNIPVLEFSAVTDITHAGTAGQRTWTLTIETGAEDARPQPGPKETGSVVAEAVVCAAGGGTYAHALKLGEATTNPANSNEKIYRLLERLGLKESDRDLFQYQPFGIVRPLQGRGRCVPETITNFNIDIRDRSGALICNTRQDRLSMVAAMKAAHGAGRSYVFDDGDWAFAMGIPQDNLAQIRQAFPKLEGILREDSSTIYVRPILHYYLGGFPER